MVCQKIVNKRLRRSVRCGSSFTQEATKCSSIIFVVRIVICLNNETPVNVHHDRHRLHLARTPLSVLISICRNIERTCANIAYLQRHPRSWL